jgi:hypothetical protein
MQRVKTGWAAFIFTLVVLLAPLQASATLKGMGSSGGGGTGGGDGGDPDHPTGAWPGLRTKAPRGDYGSQASQMPSMNREWLRGYLTLISGLRSFYLRF